MAEIDIRRAHRIEPNGPRNSIGGGIAFWPAPVSAPVIPTT
jgi:hypothetical protein